MASPVNHLLRRQAMLTAYALLTACGSAAYTGKPVTRAMQLGTEKHRLAIQCTKEKLDALIPGHFSLEKLLEVAPNIVTPIRGIIRWIASLE